MKKLVIYSFLALIISLLAACGKGDCTEISGKVIEKGSNKPIADAKVVISQCVKGEGFGSSAICIEIDTVLTDFNGNYTYSNNEKDAINYRLSAYKDNYMQEVFQAAPAGESSKNIDFVMRAAAWVKFRIKNVNPSDVEDLIKAPGASGADNRYHFYGKKVDTTYTLKNYFGNLNYSFSWFVEKKSIKNTLRDSVLCKSLDTVFYEIKY